MGDGRVHVPGQTLACAKGPAGALPSRFARVVGGMSGEGRRVGHHRRVGRAPAPVSEIVPRVVSAGPGTLRVPFPILRRARPRAVVSVTSPCDVEVGDEAAAAGHLAVGPGGPDLRPGGA